MYILFTGLLLLAFVGCSHSLPPPAANRPTTLKLEKIGLPVGGVDRFYLTRNGFLIHEEGYDSVFRGITRKKFSPSDTQWEDFYHQLHGLRINQWKATYMPSDNDPKLFVDDGFFWSFLITSSEFNVTSEGDNAIPNKSDPAKTSHGWDDVYMTNFGTLGVLFHAFDSLTIEQNAAYQATAAE